MTLGEFTTIDMDGREHRNNPDLESLFYDLEYAVNIVENMENSYPYDIMQGDVGIERKRVDDFIASIKKKKTSKHSIWDQCNRMSQTGMYSYILIEGMGDDLALDTWLEIQGGGTYKTYYGGMASISVRYNIPVLYCHNQDWFAYEAGKIFKSHREGKAGIARENKLVYVDPEYPIAAQILALCGLDKRALEIAEKLNLTDIMDVISLRRNDLISIDGIGDIIANRIIKRLGIRTEL